jgi:DNA-binding FadR family transcriptional regulator
MSGSDDTPRREAHTACARDHIAILDAIEAEDMAAAARLMREHLDGSACP